SQLDEPQGRLAPGDDGVHARAVAIVGADPAVAVTVQCGRVAARSAVSLTGDEIDERCFLGLLHGLPSLCCGLLRARVERSWDGCAGGSSGPERRVLAQYTGPNHDRQEGKMGVGCGSAPDSVPIRRTTTRRRPGSTGQARRV